MIVIRDAVAADLPTITRIYNETAAATTASYILAPVTVDNRIEWWRQRVADGFPVLVAVDVPDGKADEVAATAAADPNTADPGVVLGYTSYGQFREIAGYLHTVEHTIWVDPVAHGRGIGRALMAELIDRARTAKVHVMIGVIDEDNIQSCRFHETLGFELMGRLPETGRKNGQWLTPRFYQLTLAES